MTELKTDIDWSTLLTRGLIFASVWWILTDGNTESWWIGAPVVSLTLYISLNLLPPTTLVWRQVFSFIPIFIKHSLQGGFDVARRALQPNMDIAPELIEYPLRLPPGLPSVIMANIINLLPGTLTATIGQDVLTVHVLNRNNDVIAEIEKVETAVARMFSIPLDRPSGENT